ncbi:MAG: hypothetical protein ACE5QW_00325 [Thermoplasmata archaeon]
MAESCVKCGSGTKTSLQVSLFAPYRPGGSTVEQKWPLALIVCENCGYAESYVEREDIPRLRSLSETQERLSKTKVQALK